MFVDQMNNCVTSCITEGEAVKPFWTPISSSVKWAIRLNDRALFLLQCPECSSKYQNDLVFPPKGFCQAIR